MRTEMPAYRTETGRLMICCQCAIKVRVTKDGTLARHWAYDRELADEDCPEGTCVFSGRAIAMDPDPVMGLEFGVVDWAPGAAQ